ncbi:MAG: RluA family pseudouridine synthase [Chthoniobacterales bacterium]
MVSPRPQSEKMREVRVTPAQKGLRLDRFLALALPDFSRSRLQALIAGGCVQLNGKAPRKREIVRANDLVTLEAPLIQKIDALAEEIPLDVIFEDADLVVLNKPAGLVVHPGAGHQSHTLVNALLHHCTSLSGIGGKERPGIVHRLDKETSGCLVVAKNDQAHQALSQQFAARTVGKVYLALVQGVPRRSQGVIDAAIGRHAVHRQRMAVRKTGGRAARTDYRVLQSGNDMSLVECTLHSGRTHQIRVHLHHLGHPVLGDKLYGTRNAAHVPRQMLHASRLALNHPRTDERMEWEAPLPNDFLSAIDDLRGADPKAAR